MNDKNFVIKRSEVYQSRGILDITFSLLFVLLCVGCQRQGGTPPQAARIAHQEACVVVVQGARSRQACSKALGIVAPFVRHDMACAGMQAALLFGLGYTSQAEQAYRRALSLPGTAELRCRLRNDYACLRAQQGALKDAVCQWRQLLMEPLYGSPEVVWRNISYALRARGRYGLALRAARLARRCQVNC